jgi:hypothetical protein
MSNSGRNARGILLEAGVAATKGCPQGRPFHSEKQRSAPASG